MDLTQLADQSMAIDIAPDYLTPPSFFLNFPAPKTPLQFVKNPFYHRLKILILQNHKKKPVAKIWFL